MKEIWVSRSEYRRSARLNIRHELRPHCVDDEVVAADDVRVRGLTRQHAAQDVAVLRNEVEDAREHSTQTHISQHLFVDCLLHVRLHTQLSKQVLGVARLVDCCVGAQALSKRADVTRAQTFAERRLEAELQSSGDLRDALQTRST